ncbi:glycoside hydrolase family 18 protein [uncultured Microbulbifer sp.]|uniref:glycoside hydrolase family 18 protein n=1 Tax=uncultured Microbulbifer sp. TaxID=348147 RepID=UPI002604689C|nr:glycoside hydrolase family 18 protein [uncultured Microbulbifer sp.]
MGNWLRWSSLWLALLASGALADSGSEAPPVSPDEMAVMGYYTGDGRDLARYDFNKLTHLIYSFVYLDGNEMAFRDENARASYRRLLALKAQYPHLRVMLALGGWGGCEPCSDVFSSAENRRAFAQSVKTALDEIGGDGLDMDWEYPSIEGHPGHPFKPEDRDNFTALVRQLRATLGQNYLITVAAGGFDEFLQKSLDWQAVTPLINSVNLMSYDLVNGFSTVTGHHTPLYSTERQKQSTDNAVQFLLNAGVPAQKIVIGAAFYSRVWEGVEKGSNGRYQSGKHVPGLRFSQQGAEYREVNGYSVFWDEEAGAAYAYNPEQKRYATFDNPKSVALKTEYAKKLGLGGIMFWELPGDSEEGVLLDAIYSAKTAE